MKNATRIIAIVLVLLMALALIPMAAWATDGEHEHVYSTEFTEDTPATCIAAGSKSRHCTVEGCDAKGEHSYAEEFTVDQAATCTAAGSKSRHCTTVGCTAKTEETVILATGEHSFTAETATADYLKSAATCQSPAIYYKSCAVCGLSSAGTAQEATFESGTAGPHDFDQTTGLCKTPGCTAKRLVGTVTVSGTAIPGQTLTASFTGNNGTAPVTYNWVEVPLDDIGTGASYTVKATDVGKLIACEVSCSEIEGYVYSEAVTVQEAGSETGTEPTAADFTLVTYGDSSTYTKGIGMPVPCVETTTTCEGYYSYGTGAAPGTRAPEGTFNSPGSVSTRNLLDSLPDGTYTLYFNYTWNENDTYIAIGQFQVVSPESITLNFTISGPGRVLYRGSEISSGPFTANVGGQYSFQLIPDENKVVTVLTVNGEEQTDKTSFSRIIRNKSLDNAQIVITFGDLPTDAVPIAVYSEGFWTQDDLDGLNPLNSKMTEDSAGKDSKTHILYVMPFWNGNTSAPVEAKDIPAEGLSVTLPFPQGITAANRSAYTFRVYHYHAGTIDTPPFTVSDAGVTVTLKQFSPVGILALSNGELSVYTEGMPVVGATLTAEVTPSDAKVNYQWQREGAAISGATKETYELTSADVGKKITCKVTDQDDTTVTAESNAITPSKPAVAVNRVVDDGDTQKGKLGGLCPGLPYGPSSSGPWTVATGTTADVTVEGLYYYQVATPGGEFKVLPIGTVEAYYTITTRLLYGKGTVDPTTRTVKRGASGGKFTFTPNKNYKIADIRIDGTRIASSSVSSTYTLGPIYSKTLLEYGFTYTGTTPHTGDDSNLALWAELCVLSALGVTAILAVTRRKSKS